MPGAIETVLSELVLSHVRFVVVGGVAVVMHGHPRFTADLDLALDLTPANLAKAQRCFDGLGYSPRVPVRLAELASAEVRQRLVTEKSMTVLSLASERFRVLEVDVFVELPFIFEEAWAEGVQVQLELVTVPVVSMERLIAMKRAVGRPRDLEDITALEALSVGRVDV